MIKAPNTAGRPTGRLSAAQLIEAMRLRQSRTPAQAAADQPLAPAQAEAPAAVYGGGEGRRPQPRAAAPSQATQESQDIVVTATKPETPPTANIADFMARAPAFARGMSLAIPRREQDGRVYLMPSLDPQSGRVLSPVEAQERFQQTGEHFGAFRDEAQAMAYLESLSGGMA